MKIKADKPFSVLRSVPAIVFSVLFVLGVFAGCLYSKMQELTAWDISDSVFLFGLFADGGSGWKSTFSGFLFDFLFFDLIVFLFGLTFFGVSVIPAVVMLKGVTLGISLTVLLEQEKNVVFIQRWITYLPFAALCSIVLLLFAVQACGFSLKLFRSLTGQGSSAVSLKSYGVQFVVSLFIFVVAGVLHCILNFVALIIF